jgi:AhpD family alkylhydroperoxidase
MIQRLDYTKVSLELFRKYLEFSMAVGKSSIGGTLKDLVQLRASQINGCAFCVDMHAKEAKIHGERELRLYHVSIWRESGLFSEKERAALEWTEALTRLGEHGVPDDVYERVRQQFNEKELVDLTFAVMAINGWNRMSISMQVPPGSADEMYGLTKAGLS